MARHSIIELRDKHIGNDIYVVASGASAGYIDPTFFDNKITICVNEAWMRFSNANYTVRKENKRSVGAFDTGIPLIISRYDCGVVGGYVNEFPDVIGRDYYVFEHVNNSPPNYAPDLSVIGSDKIVVSYSTITSAMHVAAYMGALNIIVVGHDCGTLDGSVRMSGLPFALGGEVFYRAFLKSIEPHSILVREKLKEVYKPCNIYSLNPFLNFGLEGHEYQR